MVYIGLQCAPLPNNQIPISCWYYRHCVEPLSAILRLRARWFALPNLREGKTLRFVSPPVIPCVIWSKPTQLRLLPSTHTFPSTPPTLSTPVQAPGAGVCCRQTPPLRASRLPQLVLPTLWRHLVRSLCMRRANEIAPFGHCRTQRSQLKSMIAVSLPLALMRLSQRESHRVTKPKYWVKVVRLQKKKEQLALLLWSKGQRSNFLCPHMSPATPTYLSEQVMNSAVSIGAASQ